MRCNRRWNPADQNVATVVAQKHRPEPGKRRRQTGKKRNQRGRAMDRCQATRKRAVPDRGADPLAWTCREPKIRPGWKVSWTC